jgi:hypothetical protein
MGACNLVLLLLPLTPMQSGWASEVDIKSSWWRQLFKLNGDSDEAWDISARFPNIKVISWFDFAKLEGNSNNNTVVWWAARAGALARQRGYLTQPATSQCLPLLPAAVHLQPTSGGHKNSSSSSPSPLSALCPLPHRSISRPEDPAVLLGFAQALQQPLDSLLAINRADSILASNQTELLLASSYFQVGWQLASGAWPLPSTARSSCSSASSSASSSSASSSSASSLEPA